MIYEVLDFLKKYIDISLVLILNYILLSAFYNKKEVIDYLLFLIYKKEGLQVKISRDTMAPCRICACSHSEQCFRF